MLHVTLPRTDRGLRAPVTSINHQLGWLIRLLDHVPATGCNARPRN